MSLCIQNSDRNTCGGSCQGPPRQPALVGMPIFSGISIRRPFSISQGRGRPPSAYLFSLGLATPPRRQVRHRATTSEPAPTAYRLRINVRAERSGQVNPRFGHLACHFISLFHNHFRFQKGEMANWPGYRGAEERYFKIWVRLHTPFLLIEVENLWSGFEPAEDRLLRS
jgi:hypothetical protein